MKGWSLRMPNTIPDSHVDLIAGPVYCVLTTVSPEGGPENTIVWSSWDGSHVLVNTADGRRKANNIRNNPRVALIALDPMDALRWIDVRGIVEEIVEDKDFQNINAMRSCIPETTNFLVNVSQWKGNTKKNASSSRLSQNVLWSPNHKLHNGG